MRIVMVLISKITLNRASRQQDENIQGVYELYSELTDVNKVGEDPS